MKMLEESKLEAKQNAERFICEANMALFGATDALEGYASPAFEQEIREIQCRLRNTIEGIRNLR